MATDYSTIQQHQPLRVPSGWDRQEKAFVVQMEEILDDIYRRFGRLRLEDMSKTFRKQIADDEGNIAELIVDVGQITIDVGNKYDKVSGITINTNGIDITGSKYLKLNSGCELDIESGGDIKVKSGGELTVQSGGSLSINSGGELDINATGNLKLTGATVKISSGSIFEVDSENFKIDSNGRKVITGRWEMSAYGLINKSVNTYFNKDIKYQLVDTFSGAADYCYSELQFGNSVADLNTPNPSFISRICFNAHDAHENKTVRFPIDMFPDQNNIQVGEQYEGYYTYFYGQRFIPPYTDVSSFVGNALSYITYGFITNLNYSTIVQNSSKDIKHNIRPLESVGEKLDNLEPVTFVYDEDADEKTRTGLIYEDTVEVMPEICTNDEANKAINYVELIPMFLKEIQDLRARVAALEGGN